MSTCFPKLLGHFLPTLMCCLISRLASQAEWRQGNRTTSVCWYFYCFFKRKVQIIAKLQGDAARLKDEAALLIPHKYTSSYFSQINVVKYKTLKEWLYYMWWKWKNTAMNQDEALHFGFVFQLIKLPECKLIGGKTNKSCQKSYSVQWHGFYEYRIW